jgi:hypothetical protein
MVWLCRVLFLFCFALFWGGLTFYTGFVVRISHDVLSDPMDGGLITQRVTVLLQYLGVVTAVLMAVNGWQVRQLASRYGTALLTLTVILSLSLLGLFVVHAQLDAVIDGANYDILDPDQFDTGHRRYNQLTTVEWITSLIYLPVTVIAWRRVDQLPKSDAEPSAG